MKLVPVGNQYATVDDEDYELVSQYTWSLGVSKSGGFYARHSTNPGSIRMHELVMGTKWVDHQDRNGLNNQKDNLRKCTPQQNSFNSKPRGGKSKYKGVTKQQYETRWRAQITKNGKHYHLGFFVREEDAAHAYDRKARELFGEFPYQNFPQGES